MSFAKEMRDFLAGYSAMQKIGDNEYDRAIKTERAGLLSDRRKRLNDPELLRLQKQGLQQRIASGAADAALKRELLQRRADPYGIGGMAIPAATPTAPTVEHPIVPPEGYADGGMVQRKPTAMPVRSTGYPVGNAPMNVASGGGMLAKPAAPQLPTRQAMPDGPGVAQKPQAMPMRPQLPVAGMRPFGALSGAMQQHPQYQQFQQLMGRFRGALPPQLQQFGAQLRSAIPGMAQGFGQPVRAYAEGGPVEPDEDEDDEDIFNGVSEGLEYAGYGAGESSGGEAAAIRLPAAPRQARRPAAGDTIDPGMFQAVLKKIDPEGKIPEQRRNLMAYGAMYNYFKDKPGIRQQAMGGLTQYLKDYSGQYAALAEHAFNQGDMNLAAQAATKAYANVPAGHSARFFFEGGSTTQEPRLVFETTDSKGKTIKRGLMKPEQLIEAISGVKDFGSLVREMQEVRARQRKPRKLTDVQKARAAIDEGEGAVTKEVSRYDNKKIARVKERGPEIDVSGAYRLGGDEAEGADNGGVRETKHIASVVLNDNPHLSPEVASQVATSLAGLDSTPMNFQRSDDGSVVAKVGRTSVKLSPDVVDQIATLRGANNTSVMSKLDAETTKKFGETGGLLAETVRNVKTGRALQERTDARNQGRTKKPSDPRRLRMPDSAWEGEEP